MKIASDYEVRTDESGATLTWRGETFTAEAAVLREGGWVRREDADEHCGHDLNAAYDDGVQEGWGQVPEGQDQVLERWHNDNHAGVYRFCYEEPCHALRGDSHS